MRRTVCAIGLTFLALAALGAGEAAFHPDIPKVWDDRAVETMEVPLAQRDRSPRYMTSAEYYALKVRPIYRSYPAYAKGREPAGYLESLKEREPEIIFDPAKLHTKEDWIQAGKLVFESETQYRPVSAEQHRQTTHWRNRSPVMESFLFFSPVFDITCERRACWRSGSTHAPTVTRASCLTARSSKVGRASAIRLSRKQDAAHYARALRKISAS